MHLTSLLAVPTVPRGSGIRLQPLQQLLGMCALWTLLPRPPTFGSAVRHLWPRPTRHPQFERAPHPPLRSLHQTLMTSFPPFLLATPFASPLAESVENFIVQSISLPMRGERHVTTISLRVDTSAT